MRSDDIPRIETRYAGVRAPDGVKWVGQFATEKNGTEFVRDEAGAVIRFDDRGTAEHEALKSMMRRLNGRARRVCGKVHKVIGSGRGRHVSADTVWKHG